MVGVGVEGIAVTVGVAVAVRVGVVVGVAVTVGVGVGVTVGVAVAVEVAVAVAVGVGVAVNRLKPFESLDGLYWSATPAKFALRVVIPAPLGVTPQVASPLASVVPSQPAPPKLKFTDSPAMAVTGFIDTSVRFADRVIC
jgi:hypothetical protein